jgi:hypothetical protein
MCGFTLDFIDIHSLTPEQKKKLKNELTRRKKEIDRLITDIGQALKTVDKKSKRKKSRR